jgi:uncharacterized protein involved in type VI secretion and phage assembly
MSDSLLDLLAPQAADMSGRMLGVAVGIVTNNQDPDGLGRVRVHFPWLDDNVESFWARVASPMAGKDRGVYFLPEVNDEVLVAFQHGRPEAPVIIGSLWNGQDKPPAGNGDGKNSVRVIKSRSGHLIRLDDTADAEKIEIIDKSGNNKLVLDTKTRTVTIAADGDLVIQSTNGKVAISGKTVEIKSAAGAIALTSQAAMTVQAQADLTIKGAMVNIN